MARRKSEPGTRMDASITINMTQALEAEIQATIKQEGRTLAEVGRTLFEQYLTGKIDRHVPIGQVAGEMQGYFADLIRDSIQGEVKLLLSEFLPEAEAAKKLNKPVLQPSPESNAIARALRIRTDDELTIEALAPPMVEAIVDEELSDAWALYQGGQSSVFSRKIYTPIGIFVFEYVRDRLRRDPVFREAVTLRMSAYEQLLKAAAAGPDPAIETAKMLRSAEGKVYTLLGHASGRLG